MQAVPSPARTSPGPTPRGGRPGRARRRARARRRRRRPSPAGDRRGSDRGRARPRRRRTTTARPGSPGRDRRHVEQRGVVGSRPAREVRLQLPEGLAQVLLRLPVRRVRPQQPRQRLAGVRPVPVQQQVAEQLQRLGRRTGRGRSSRSTDSTTEQPDMKTGGQQAPLLFVRRPVHRSAVTGRRRCTPGASRDRHERSRRAGTALSPERQRAAAFGRIWCIRTPTQAILPLCTATGE